MSQEKLSNESIRHLRQEGYEEVHPNVMDNTSNDTYTINTMDNMNVVDDVDVVDVIDDVDVVDVIDVVDDVDVVDVVDDMDIMLYAYLENNLDDMNDFPMGALIGNMLVKFINKDNEPTWILAPNNVEGHVNIFSKDDIENIVVTENTYKDTMKVLYKLENDIYERENTVMNTLTENEQEAINSQPSSPSTINWKTWNSTKETGFSACVITAMEAISTSVLSNAVLIISSPILLAKGIHKLTWEDSGWRQHNMNGRTYWKRECGKSGRRKCQIKDDKTGKFFEVVAKHVGISNDGVDKLYNSWSHKQNFLEASIFHKAYQQLNQIKIGLEKTFEHHLTPHVSEFSSNESTSRCELSLSQSANDLFELNTIDNNAYDENKSFKLPDNAECIVHDDGSNLKNDICTALKTLATDSKEMVSIMAGRQIGRNLAQIDRALISGVNVSGDKINRIELLKDVSYNTGLVILGHMILWGGDRVVIELLCLFPKLKPYKETLHEISLGLRASHQLYTAGKTAIAEDGYGNKAKTFGWELGKAVYAYSANNMLLGIERDMSANTSWTWGTLKIMGFHYGYSKLWQGVNSGIDSICSIFATVDDIASDYNVEDATSSSDENDLSMEDIIRHFDENPDPPTSNLKSFPASQIFNQVYQPITKSTH